MHPKLEEILKEWIPESQLPRPKGRGILGGIL
jgi:hypothetical protein